MVEVPGKLLVLQAMALCFVLYRQNQQATDCPPPYRSIERIVERVEVRNSVEATRNTGSRIEERNRLSKMINEMMKGIKLQYCETLKQRKSKKEKIDTTEEREYCSEDADASARMFDKQLSKAMAHLMEGQRAAGIGDRHGKFKRQMDVYTRVSSYDSYDGSPYIENITNNAVRFLDLTVPQYGLPLYDWLVCLEVAHHVPREFQDILVDNLARHARTGIILSWAPPGPDSVHHVNELMPEEVDKVMKKVGFSLDSYSTKLLTDAAMRPWAKKNVRVYERDPGVKADKDEA
ncbi:hypothetical protein BaRGS_00013616 [Batillaria attramentaria]|uniref:S-adenosyl-L-methionine-dependent methyltransferase n=1 Tax=Batillaria attramentaria TaxID=370345 RepID=A0ABD0L6P8_9CAEN